MTGPSARFDVIIVPFPFTDRPAERRRPAVIVSGAGWNRDSGHIVCAMITAAQNSDWPLDVPVTDPDAAGLTKPCIVRMKLFTLDARFVIRRAGQLAAYDAERVGISLAALAV